MRINPSSSVFVTSLTHSYGKSTKPFVQPRATSASSKQANTTVKKQQGPLAQFVAYIAKRVDAIFERLEDLFSKILSGWRKK